MKMKAKCRINKTVSPVQNSARFCENVDILRKWANSVARLNISHSVENYTCAACTFWAIP